jgi:hypothetical protein
MSGMLRSRASIVVESWTEWLLWIEAVRDGNKNNKLSSQDRGHVDE